MTRKKVSQVRLHGLQGCCRLCREHQQFAPMVSGILILERKRRFFKHYMSICAADPEGTDACPQTLAMCFPGGRLLVNHEGRSCKPELRVWFAVVQQAGYLPMLHLQYRLDQSNDARRNVQVSYVSLCCPECTESACLCR